MAKGIKTMLNGQARILNKSTPTLVNPCMITDDTFNEAYKPLHIPSAYHANDSWKDRVVFTLAELGSGTADDVAAELQRRDNSLDIIEVKDQTTNILTALFDKGLIKGTQLHQGLLYNLSKILVQNSGSTHPGK